MQHYRALLPASVQLLSNRLHGGARRLGYSPIGAGSEELRYGSGLLRLLFLANQFRRQNHHAALHALPRLVQCLPLLYTAVYTSYECNDYDLHRKDICRYFKLRLNSIKLFDGFDSYARFLTYLFHINGALLTEVDTRQPIHHQRAESNLVEAAFKGFP